MSSPKDKINGRGGKRKGAGRKPSGNVTFSARVKPEHVAKVKAFIDRLPSD